MRERVGGNDLWRGVRYLDGYEIGPGYDAHELAKLEAVLSLASQLNSPFHSLGGRSDDFRGQRHTETEGVNRIAKVLGQRNVKRVRNFDEFLARELELCLAGLVMILEDGSDDRRVAVRLFKLPFRRFLIGHRLYAPCLVAGAAAPHRWGRRNGRLRRTYRRRAIAGRPGRSVGPVSLEPRTLPAPSRPWRGRAKAARNCRFAGTRAISSRGSETSRGRSAAVRLRRL